MALDGIMLRFMANELKNRLVGGKIEKIQQPSRDELVLVMRANGAQERLLISTRADCPRIGSCASGYENPVQPPMFCMLLRKRLGGARLLDIEQLGVDRVLLLRFDCYGELGDKERLTLAVEIMGRCSNAILLDPNEKIIDAMRRVDGSMSMTRLILPGLSYSPPPSQGKISVEEHSPEEIVAALLSQGDIILSKSIMAKLDGVSPIISRELAFRAAGDCEARCGQLDTSERQRLVAAIAELKAMVEAGAGSATMLLDNGAPKDIAMMELHQYGETAKLVKYNSFCELLEGFYAERERNASLRVRSADILKVLTMASDRAARTIIKRKSELENAKGREQLRLYGDLLNANLYRLKKGESCAELENFYSDNGEMINIPLDQRLTPAQNAQRYYRDYRKQQTAEAHLLPLIESGERELQYLDSVFDELSRARTNAELSEIRQELIREGYVKKKLKDKQKQISLKPLRFVSDDGFEIICGRNNRQNEQITLKEAERGDLWLHAAKQPGSHVIIKARNGEVSELATEQAAIIAAVHSKGAAAGLVAVDYTAARKVARHPLGRVGMVSYTDQKTVYVHPDEELARRLSAE